MKRSIGILVATAAAAACISGGVAHASTTTTTPTTAAPVTPITAQQKAINTVTRWQTLPEKQVTAEFLALSATDAAEVKKVITPDKTKSETITTPVKQVASTNGSICWEVYNEHQIKSTVRIKLFKVWQAVRWCGTNGNYPHSGHATNRGGSVQLKGIYNHPGRASEGKYDALGWEKRFWNEERFVLVKYAFTFEECIQHRVGANGNYSVRFDCEVAAP